MIKVIQSDLFHSIGASQVTKSITPSDPTRETDHLDHDSSDQSDPNGIRVLWPYLILLQVGQCPRNEKQAWL